MKTFKNTLIAIAGTFLLLAMIMVNVQVGLNDGTSSDLTFPGTDITLIESVFAQDTPPGEEGGDLGCDDLTWCDGSRSCGSPGVNQACQLDCEDDGIEPGEEYDIKCPDLE